MRLAIEEGATFFNSYVSSPLRLRYVGVVPLLKACLYLLRGYFYGNPPDVTTNLQLIARFCEAHPELEGELARHRSRERPLIFSPGLTDSFFLSVKGGITPEFKPDASIEFLREECEKINKILKHRKMDMYEVARVDKDTGIENVSRSSPRHPVHAA